MRYQLVISQSAEEELEALWDVDPEAASMIDVILEELECDQELLDALTEHGFVRQFDPSFDVKKWISLWKRQINLWRLKPFTSDGRSLPYRVIYAYVPSSRRYVVMGIVPREWNYDLDDPRTARILAEYAEL